MNTTKALTLRLPPELYQSGQRIAQARRVSLNALIQESLQSLIRAEQQRQLYDDFTLLAEDAEAANVEFALAAQHETLLRDEAREAS